MPSINQGQASVAAQSGRGRGGSYRHRVAGNRRYPVPSARHRRHCVVARSAIRCRIHGHLGFITLSTFSILCLARMYFSMTFLILVLFNFVHSHLYCCNHAQIFFCGKHIFFMGAEYSNNL